MRSLITKQAERFLRERKNYKRWLAVFFCLAAVVALGTVMVLRYTGRAMTGDPKCGMEEHTHTEECYQEVLVCGLEETAPEDLAAGEAAGHVHEEACYDEAGELICGLEGTAGEMPEGHVHTADCYERQLVCGLEEHTHTEACYSTDGEEATDLAEGSSETEDGAAKAEEAVETPEIWEATLPSEEQLDGTWAENLVAVAESQVGYQESAENVIQDEAGNQKGYSRYGAWFGNEYGDWNAMFASFCLNYAGVPVEAVPQNEDISQWVAQLQEMELYQEAAEGLPQAGDLIFLGNENGELERTAVVKKVEAQYEEDGETVVSAMVTAIEGDVEDQVKETVYTDTDAALLGCVSMEEAVGRYVANYPEEATALGLMPAAGPQETDTEADPEEAEVYEFTQTAETENYIVAASYNTDADLPEDAVLKVEEFDENTQEYKQHSEQLGYEPKWLLKIGFFQGEEEVEPVGKVLVKVTMKGEEEQKDYKIVHFKDDGMEELEGIGKQDETGVSTEFTTDSFSYYSAEEVEPTAAGTANYREVTSLTSLYELEGKSFVITCQNGVKRVLSAEGKDENGLKGIGFENDLPASDSAVWTFIRPDDRKSDFWIKSSNGKYLNISGTSVTLSDQAVKLQVSIVENGNKVRISKDGYYLNNYNRYSAGEDGKFAGWNDADDNTKLTLYTQKPVDGRTYTIQYWQNENSISAHRDDVTDKGTLVATREVTAYEQNGKLFVDIPLTGDDIGKLNDLENGSKFYGWSLFSSANYKGLYPKSITYCGVDLKLDSNFLNMEDQTVHTYQETGKITKEITTESDVIDLYATWAAAPDTYDGRPVRFYIRLDGTIPNEPSISKDLVDNAAYTAGVSAKESNDPKSDVVQQPLKYWMHIYGPESTDIINANLNYQPCDADVLAAIKAKNSELHFLDSNGKTIDFSEMTVEKFTEDFYIAWYVCKDSTDNWWHIDGTLLQKNKWNLVYDKNCADTIDGIIPVKQHEYEEVVTVYNTQVAGGDLSEEPPVRPGYTFLGWSTTRERPANDDEMIQAGNKVSVDKATGRVTVNGEIWPGVTAVEKGAVKELTLYAQWEKGTNVLTIEKVDKDETGMSLGNAEFALYQYDETNEVWGTEPVTSIETKSDGAGNYDQLRNVTWYKLVETKAPVGFEARVEFYFEIQVVDGALEVVETDSGRNPLTHPHDWLHFVYNEDASTLKIKIQIEEDAIKQKATFKKVDEKDQPLRGAAFTLYREKNGKYEEVSYLREKESNQDGIIVETTELIYGNYKLEETKAPEGYAKTVIEFTVGADGISIKKAWIGENEVTNPRDIMQVTSTSREDKTTDNQENTYKDFIITVKNTRISQTVKLIKVVNEKQETGLPGAEFALYPEKTVIDEDTKEEKKIPDEEKPIWSGKKSEADGLFYSGVLVNGTYYLVETKAPDGYNLLTEPVKIIVDEQGVTATYKAGSNLAVKSESDNTYEVRIPNSAGHSLPETGGPGTILYTFGGLAILAIGLVYGLSMKRKQERGYK